jgi:hypothetical protein
VHSFGVAGVRHRVQYKAFTAFAVLVSALESMVVYLNTTRGAVTHYLHHSSFKAVV